MVDAVRAAPVLVPDPGPPDITLDKAVRNKHNIITRNLPLPLNHDGLEQERSELNDSVLFFDHIRRC